MSRIFQLPRPVMAHGEEITELELAEPTSKMVMALGYPYMAIDVGDGEPGVELRPKVAGRYIMQLAQVPLSTVEALPIPVLQEIHGWLMGFFGEEGMPSS
jgi:hypothetical protein